MKLALGTVQFGQKYGIAGRGEQVPIGEIRSILMAASKANVRVLDTAAAYGDIEPRLAELCANMPFSIISKIPALPGLLQGETPVEFALNAAKESKKRLGDRLQGLMFHSSDDLTGPHGKDIWQAVSDWAKSEKIKLGVSCYAPDDFLKLKQSFDIQIAQLPGNALDQRIAALAPSDCTIFLRSAFLQGLLLLPLTIAQRRLPPAASALEKWHNWYQAKGLDPLVAALSVVKSFKAVSTVIVGVDNLAQFEGIHEAWQAAKPLEAHELADANLDIIDPRRWKGRSS
ncbi:MAG TPA: aldo/keto reductase [Alphaproteobacteria bacterium]|nr:aldo/keto reductase [Alphaproteobacteria bacterium]